MSTDEPIVSLRSATMGFGDRVLWSGLDLDVGAGEFVAILGPNGSGKSTLLKVLLGLVRLTGGTVRITGTEATRGNSHVGYIPQQTTMDPEVSLRSRDLVGFGWDGHRLGVGLRGRRTRRARVDHALAAVGAEQYADSPVGRLSGGELQRLRVAQALVGDPAVLLCDEPLLSLDLAHQHSITHLIDQRRRDANTAVLFVTHEINPILSLVDRVLYLVDGQFRIGAPTEVMTSEVLSDLYGTEVDVIEVRGRLIVVGGDDSVVPLPGHHVHHPDEAAHS
jgi:zinc/manganese transport system ATP-binding protein